MLRNVMLALLLALLSSVLPTLALAAAAPNVIVVGGSSGMGAALALETCQQGGRVLLVSRSPEKLKKAKAKILEHVPEATVETASLDAMDEEAVQALGAVLQESTVPWNGLAISAAGPAAHGPMTTLPTDEARYMMDTKFWGAYHCAKHLGPLLQDGGAVVFVAGILNRRPGLNCVPLAVANGALEGLTRSLALEWGPRLRVNCLSPGFCNTERFDRMDPDRKEQMLLNTAASLPSQRVGTPQDMGKALYYLLTASFTTGVVLDVDGGHMIRQYANPTNDPMRK